MLALEVRLLSGAKVQLAIPPSATVKDLRRELAEERQELRNCKLTCRVGGMVVAAVLGGARPAAATRRLPTLLCTWHLPLCRAVS